MTGKEAVACAERRAPVTSGGIIYKRISAVIWRYDNEKRIEVEMEDYLRSLDAEYLITRRKLLQLVVHRPTLMPFVIKTVDKGWKYMRKLFAPYNI